jgi:hypothetical protein
MWRGFKGCSMSNYWDLALNERRFRGENPAIFDRIGAEEKKE